MKQVVFAVFLLAMASLTGCLNEEDSPVDDKTDDSTSDTTEDTDTTQDGTDTTDDTKDDELIDPVVNSNVTSPDLSEIEATLNSINNNLVASAPYDPPEESFIQVTPDMWFQKSGNTLTSSCFNFYAYQNLVVYDVNMNIIYTSTYYSSYLGFTASGCSDGVKLDVTLNQEPVRIGTVWNANVVTLGEEQHQSTFPYGVVVTF